MERPIGLTDSVHNTWALSVLYNLANQMTSLTLFNGFNAETRGYNSLLQLTSVT